MDTEDFVTFMEEYLLEHSEGMGGGPDPGGPSTPENKEIKKRQVERAKKTSTGPSTITGT